jgi:hypothetical protein
VVHTYVIPVLPEPTTASLELYALKSKALPPEPDPLLPSTARTLHLYYYLQHTAHMVVSPPLTSRTSAGAHQCGAHGDDQPSDHDIAVHAHRSLRARLRGGRQFLSLQQHLVLLVKTLLDQPGARKGARRV